jgi:hypothetical protein
MEKCQSRTRVGQKYGYPDAYSCLAGGRYTNRSISPADLKGCRGLSGKQLLAQAEFADDCLIALGIVFLQVVKQATPLADQHEKTAA